MAPTLRLYLLSDPAGALEPCGCVKDQLGGMDHLAAFIEKERARVPASGTLVVGPTFFMDKELAKDRASQDRARAEAMARTFKSLGLLALTPGANDLADGKETLKKLAAESGGKLVGPEGVSYTVFAVGGVKVGVIGVAAGTPEPFAESVKKAVASAKGEGAEVVIASAAVGRGEAKRLADFVPELALVLVGTPGSSGEANTETPTGERIGNVLIAETGNHVQTVGVVDFYVRGRDFVFQDASSLDQNRRRAELMRKSDELRGKIADLERDKKGQLATTDELRTELRAVERDRDALDMSPAPKSGSYVRYRTVDVRQSLGASAVVADLFRDYYKRVNDENKMAFASRAPRPVTGDEPHYAGIDSCTNCHSDARKVWDKTAHAHAYATLSKDFKEFNLDCVSCHVTGYDRPGGSTVTFVDKLKNVQCEVCHGPGSKHADSPTKWKIPVAKPSADSCTSCHHPPHVHSFDGPSKLQEILGPGHGRPKT
jgi:hypothetical protein